MGEPKVGKASSMSKKKASKQCRAIACDEEKIYIGCNDGSVHCKVSKEPEEDEPVDSKKNEF